MEFHMINLTYAALHMRAQTEKTTFSCKDDSTLMEPTWRWTYSALRYFCDLVLIQDDHILPWKGIYHIVFSLGSVLLCVVFVVVTGV